MKADADKLIEGGSRDVEVREGGEGNSDFEALTLEATGTPTLKDRQEAMRLLLQTS